MTRPSKFEIMRMHRGEHPTRVDREWVLHQIDRAELETLRAIQQDPGWSLLPLPQEPVAPPAPAPKPP